jgi:hypothetical protein
VLKPEDCRVRPKHVVEEYTQEKYVAFSTVITLIYRRITVIQQDAEIQH